MEFESTKRNAASYRLAPSLPSGSREPFWNMAATAIDGGQRRHTVTEFQLTEQKMNVASGP
jgi:hypothetical protein